MVTYVPYKLIYLMKKLFRLLLIIPVLFLFSSCTSSTNKSVRIGYLPLTANLPLFVAIENGYFDDENIKVELIKYETSNQMLEALVTNRIDVETATSSSVTVTLSQTLSNDIKTFMLNVFDESNYLSSIIVANNSSINDVKDLHGKVIGTYPGSTMKLYTAQYLKNLGIEYKDILQISPASQLSALSSGSVDALLTLEPTGSLAEINNLGRVLVKAPIETKVLTPWVAGTNSFSNNFCKENPEITKKIINVFYKSVDWIRENPDVARKTLSKYTAIQDSAVYSVVPIPNYWKLEEIDIRDFQKMADHLYVNKDIEKEINVNDILLNIK